MVERAEAAVVPFWTTGAVLSLFFSGVACEAGAVVFDVGGADAWDDGVDWPRAAWAYEKPDMIADLSDGSGLTEAIDARCKMQMADQEKTESALSR